MANLIQNLACLQMIPFTFPKRQALAGSIWCLFIKQKFMPGNFRLHLTLYLPTLGFCMSHLSITVMKNEAVLVMWLYLPLFIIDFAGQSFLKHPLYWDHQFRTLKLSVMELVSELASIQLGIDCSTLIKNDTVLDCMSGPWLRLSSRTPNGSAMKFSFSSILCFLYFFSSSSSTLFSWICRIQ